MQVQQMFQGLELEYVHAYIYACLVQAIGGPRNGVFFANLTLIMDYYILLRTCLVCINMLPDCCFVYKSYIIIRRIDKALI